MRTDVETTPLEDAPEDAGGRSGTVFVAAALVGLTAFVAFLVVGSPRLLEMTEALAPPVAPQPVGAGNVDGVPWSAEAREVGERACLVLDVGGDVTEACLESRPRGSVEAAGIAEVPAADGRLAYLLTAPRVRSVEIATTARTETLVPSVVDFRDFDLAFPIGFTILELDAGEHLQVVTALDRDGAVRQTADCDPTGVCHPR